MNVALVRFRFAVLSLAGFVWIVAISGCSPADDGQPSGGTTQGADSHGDENHGHVHGPQDGEMFAIADAGLKGEWVAKYADNLVTFYIYEEDGKTEKKIAADRLVASRKSAETETWEIPALNPESGTASRFQIVDEAFAIAMKTTGATLEVEIDGVKYSTQLARDPHAH
jgi:hypothetical protein